GERDARALLLRQQRDDRGRHRGRAGHRNFRARDAQLARAVQRAAVEREGRLSAKVPPDLDIAERQTAPADSERLHRRLFRREPAGDVLRPRARMTAARRDFPGPEDAADETVPPAVEDGGDAVDFGEVETEEDFHALTSSRRTARSAGAAGSDPPSGRHRAARLRGHRRRACAVPAWSARASRRSKGSRGGWAGASTCRSREASLPSARGPWPCAGRRSGG